MPLIITNTIGGFSTAKLQKLNPVRFNPGFYRSPKYTDQDNGALDGNGNIAAASWTALKTTLANYQAYVGLGWREDWASLEPTEGVYSGLDIVEQRCTELAAIGKRMILRIRTRSFLPTDHVAPAWARNATYDGGEHAYGSGTTTIEGYNVNWYDPATQAKLVLLAQQIATRMAEHSNFEGVILMESAYGSRILSGVVNELSAAQVDDHFAGLLQFISTVKATKHELMTIAYSNVRAKSPTYIPALVSAGVGIGGPDCFVQPQGDPLDQINWPLNDTLWFQTGNKGLYLYMHDHRNHVPLSIEWQPKNFRDLTKPNIGNRIPTIQELLDASKSGSTADLQVNYAIITGDTAINGTEVSRFGGTYPNFDAQVLAKLSEPAQTATPSGGLNSQKPSIYQSVITGAW